MAALNLAGKTSGYIKLKSPDVALNATVELPNKDGILATLDDIGTGEKPLNLSANRNLIINGDMRIDQRNAGSAVTVNANSAFFPVDRFFAVGVGSAGVFTAQQVSDAPDGGDKSLKFTVTTTASSGAYRFHHNIEGNHIAHLGFGQSWAKTFTLSFWVKSSVTGTYSGSFRNSAHNRSYVFEYTINTANTWERKTITITADTTGTWLTDNDSGLKIIWGLGSSNSGTAGSWQSANYYTSTNQTEWIATSGATFYISQVQLEEGSTPSDYQFIPYDIELMRCHRYYQQFNSSTAHFQTVGSGYASSANNGRTMCPLSTTMRLASPVIKVSNITNLKFQTGSATTEITDVTNQWANCSENTQAYFQFTTSGQTSGASGVARFDNVDGSYLALNAEL